MSAQSALPRGRAAAVRLMVDTGKALRPTGGYEYTGGVDVLAAAPLFGSDAAPVPCKVKPPRTVQREAEAGGRTLVVVPGEVHIPADPDHPEYASLTVGDIWEIVTVDPSSMTQVGRRYRITGEADGSQQTACRYSVERTVS